MCDCIYLLRLRYNRGRRADLDVDATLIGKELEAAVLAVGRKPVNTLSTLQTYP